MVGNEKIFRYFKLGFRLKFWEREGLVEWDVYWGREEGERRGGKVGFRFFILSIWFGGVLVSGDGGGYRGNRLGGKCLVWGLSLKNLVL